MRKIIPLHLEMKWINSSYFLVLNFLCDLDRYDCNSFATGNNCVSSRLPEPSLSSMSKQTLSHSTEKWHIFAILHVFLPRNADSEGKIKKQPYMIAVFVSLVKINILSSCVIYAFWNDILAHSSASIFETYCTFSRYCTSPTLIPAWISNYIHYNVWDEITYPFLNFNGATVEV